MSNFYEKEGFLNRLIVQCNGFIQKDHWQKDVGMSNWGSNKIIKHNEFSLVAKVLRKKILQKKSLSTYELYYVIISRMIYTG